jgi:hypothetical protein
MIRPKSTVRPFPLRFSALFLFPVLIFLILIGIAAPAFPGGADRGAADDDAVRGLTTPELTTTGGTTAGPAEAVPFGGRPVPAVEPARPPAALNDSDWTLVDVDTFNVYLPAGKAMAVRFDHLGDSLQVIAPEESLTAMALEAIDYAPDWLGIELKDALLRLTPAYQDTFAGIILGASDPVVDEIAFVIAHTAPEVLEAFNFYPSVIAENALGVYGHDQFLDYVDIVDYGSASAGGDYYSTVRYRTAETGDTLEIEMPRERYYWDIVHMKITDELPVYVDPATGAVADPPVGKFWRDFLFTHADSGYPVLKDVLDSCEVLWEGNVDSRTNGAIGIITQWMLDVLDFGSGAERPIQPVRIYRLHLGRCGEHADITAAAARAALIATNSPLAIPDDHTWNEFYDGRWIHWEPVNTYVDSPWHYEGWGKVFLGIFDWRGDDWVWTVTERYTPHCTLSVSVTDSLGYPVDGAQVVIARKLGTVSYSTATWASTDHNGFCRFLLGDETDVFARIESDLGSVPPGLFYKKAAEATVAGEHYLWEKSIANHRPQIPVEPASFPLTEDDGYRVRINWEVASQFCYGQNRLDGKTFSDHYAGGAVEFFICNAANYAAYAASDSFYAFDIAEDAGSGDVVFTCPTFDNWYAVLSNEEHVVNTQVVRGTAELYRRTAAQVADGGDALPGLRLSQNRPNPFDQVTRIGYSLARRGPVSLRVYDIGGRLVRTLVSDTREAGSYHARWDGRDERGRAAAPGIYLCRLEAEGTTLSKKMLLIR